MRKPKINQAICSAIETLDNEGMIVKELDEVSASTLYNIRRSDYDYTKYLSLTGLLLKKLNKTNKRKQTKKMIQNVPLIGNKAAELYERFYH